jgi:hypothetical protein
MMSPWRKIQASHFERSEKLLILSLVLVRKRETSRFLALLGMTPEKPCP